MNSVVYTSSGSCSRAESAQPAAAELAPRPEGPEPGQAQQRATAAGGATTLAGMELVAVALCPLVRGARLQESKVRHRDYSDCHPLT